MVRPTMKDVAARAGVSISTVSHALNDASTLPLAAETRSRVRRVAAQLGYVPNSIARSLQAQTSRTIGVVLGKPLTHPRYAAITQGIAAGLHEAGFHPSLSDEPGALDAVAQVRGRRLDGLVFIGHDDRGVPADLAEAVSRYDVPFVSVDGGAAGPGASVDFDYGAGVEGMLDALHAEGVRAVVYVHPGSASPADAHRADAVAAWARVHPETTITLLHTGMTPERLAAIDRGTLERPGGDDLGERVRAEVARLAARAHPTAPDARAVVCAWGADIQTCYRAAKAADPRARVAALATGALDVDVWPDLSYSALPLERGGREAARLIVAAATGTASGPPPRVMLAPTLTTAPSTKRERP